MSCLLGKVAPPGQPFIHYFGAGWSKSGDFADAAAWLSHVARFAKQLASPLVVTLE